MPYSKNKRNHVLEYQNRKDYFKNLSKDPKRKRGVLKAVHKFRKKESLNKILAKEFLLQVKQDTTQTTRLYEKYHKDKNILIEKRYKLANPLKKYIIANVKIDLEYWKDKPYYEPLFAVKGNQIEFLGYNIEKFTPIEYKLYPKWFS